MENHAVGATYRPEVFFGQICDFVSINDHGAAIISFQAINATYQCGFSGTAQSYDAIDVSLGDIQVHIMQSHLLTIFGAVYFF